MSTTRKLEQNDREALKTLELTDAELALLLEPQVPERKRSLRERTEDRQRRQARKLKYFSA